MSPASRSDALSQRPTPMADTSTCLHDHLVCRLQRQGVEYDQRLLWGQPQASLRDALVVVRPPCLGVETPGYHQASLRDAARGSGLVVSATTAAGKRLRG